MDCIDTALHRVYTAKTHLTIAGYYRAWLAMAFLATLTTNLAQVPPRPRQPVQTFLTEFKLEPLPSIAPDPVATKLAIAAFINGLVLSSNYTYVNSDITLTR